MTTFPLNPTNGLTHSINDRVWSWNGYAWEKTNQSGGGGTGPAGPTGPTGPTGANGIDTYGIEYDFDTSTTASDPGSGGFRFSIDWTVGIIGNAYNAYVSETDNNGVGIDPLLDTLTDSSNTNKALIVLYKKGTPSVNAKFYVTGQTDNGSWRTLDIKYIDRDSFGTVGNGDEMMMTISIIGDQGTKGETGPAGADGAGGGGATLAAGDGLTLSPVVAGVGYTMSVDFNGATTNQVLFYDGTGISGNDAMLWADDANHPHAEMDIEGKILKAIKADEALAALDPVYITGNVGASDRVTVAKADASDPTKMPAAGIVTRSFSNNDQGYMVVTGLARNVDTSGFTANDIIYVSTGGGVTSARPSGSTDLIQNIGRVGRVQANTGTLLVVGAGRVNDVPNLIHARAGISSDGHVVIPTGISYGWSDGAYINNNSGTLQFASNSGFYSMQVAPSIVSFYRDVFCEDKLHVAGAAGISADYGMSIGTGITFPDGTFQSTAAGAGGTGYIAGAGLTLDAAGGTFSIDPTAVVHVAGVSSDGQISGGNGINLSAGNLEMANGSRMGNATNGQFRVATNEVQLLPNGDTTNGFVAAASLHYHNQKTQFKKGISADAGITANAPCNFLDNQVIRPQLKDYSETVNAIGSKTTSFSVDFEDGNVQSLTVGGNMTVSFSNAPGAGQAGTVTLVITNGGAHTVTWPSGFQTVKWPGGVAPTLTSSGTDILTFLTTNAGVTIYGFVGGLNFS